MPAARVFVSHSHKDNAYCRAFVDALRGLDVNAWYDEHNLGWGALRQVIERELQTREHFVAILSPASVASDWVNAEIDAALELLRDGHLKTFVFVLADSCTVPLLLRRYKRVEGPGGVPVPAPQAAVRVARLIASPEGSPPAQSQSAPTPRPASAAPAIPPAHFPARLADLGFNAHKTGTTEYILPPLCEVPAGPFLMGSDPKRDKQVYGDELPQHSVTLSTFAIARFPVTVAEYACFIRSGHAQPDDWRAQLAWLDHPVVSVSWRDAAAYAAWLARLTGEPWHLPTEAEWEKAGRGADGRLYPWGDAFEKTRCNTSESGIRATTPVGAYPSGAGTYGAQDLAGNVWEWTSSLVKSYPYNANDGREQPNSAGNRVLRGGSWNGDARYARAACRSPSAPGSVIDVFGFRVVCAAPGVA